MKIDSLPAPGSVTALNAATKARGTGALTSTDFLRLMTKQLQTQDPFAPMDASAMMAQMSQMSTTTGIAEMNATLRTIVGKLDAMAPAPASTPTKTAKE